MSEGPTDSVGAFLHVRTGNGGTAVVDLTVDLHSTLWTVAQAAEAAQVKPNVVHNWRYRGRLTVADRDPQGRPLFRAIDVIKAEKATRERARRTY